MVTEATLLAAVTKLAEYLATAAGNHVLANQLKNGSNQRVFKSAVLNTLESYQRSNRAPLPVVDALLLTAGPLHHEKARVELAKLLDVAERPNVSQIAAIWQQAVSDGTADVDYHEETEHLLKILRDKLWNTDEFRSRVDSREIRALSERESPDEYKPELSNSFEGLYPSFYFPLNLGRLNRSVDGIQSRDEKCGDPLEFPLSWQEVSVTTDPPRYEREMADAVWTKIKNNMDGVFLILGEPGAGKSTLLQHWCSLANSETTRLIRLRNVGQLLFEGKTKYPTSLWLLDGWDELPRDQRKVERLNALQGFKIVTCRTAIYQGEFDSSLGGASVHYVMGMLAGEQRNFLCSLASAWRGSQHTQLIRSGLADADQFWAEHLWKSVQSHNNIKLLAGSPLLLTVLALISPPGSTKQLPKDRAAFYQIAYDHLCKSRHPTEMDSLAYGVALQLLVHAVGFSRVQRNAEIPRRAFDDAYGQLHDKDTRRFSVDDLLRVAITSGVLKDSFTHYEFLHLTFQEWCLAQYLQQAIQLPASVERYWDNPDYFEVLALQWCMSTSEEREASTRFLMGVGFRVRNVAGTSHTASGLRTMIHLWSQSSAQMEQDSEQLLNDVLRRCTASELLKIAIVSDDRCPSAILRALASDPHFDVRSRVARNPNTPLDVFVSLENEVARGVRFELARNPSTPAEMLTTLATSHDKNLRWAVARNRGTSAQVLTMLSNDDDAKVRARVAENLNSPVTILTDFSRDPDNEVRRRVAGNVNTPTETLSSLGNDDEASVRRIVATNPVTSVLVLKKLSIDPDNEVRWRVAQNPNTPAELLMSLARDQSNDVCQRVASNQNTSEATLTILIGGRDEDVCQRIVSNPSASAKILESLAIHTERKVRQAVASSPNTPETLLSSLAEDSDYRVRQRVASNRNTSGSLLTLLASDSHYEVRELVASSANTPALVLAALASDPEIGVRERVARNPNTLAEQLTLLSSDPSETIRRIVASKRNTPAEALKELSHDLDKEVRRSVANNMNTSLAALKSLAGDEHEEVRQCVASSSHASVEILAFLAADTNNNVRRTVAGNCKTRAQELILLAKDPGSDVRRTVAGNPNTPTIVLSSLADDPDYNVRLQVASNPNTVVKGLVMLARDSHEGVRWRVAENPNIPFELLSNDGRE